MIVSFMNLVIIKRWNEDWIGDIPFTIIITLFYEFIFITFNYLPFLVLFTKMTPHKVEATVLAFLTGAHNFASLFGSPMLGSMLGRIVGVKQKKLDDYDLLIII